MQLEREAGQRQLKAAEAAPAKRSLDDEARSVWARMNGDAGEPLHAGDFDQ